jgi:lysophospholipase L1-like esterase
MEPDPFLRGRAWPGTPKAPYPRAKPSDALRLPVDTWMQAQIPAGVRLELTGDAAEVEIAYETKTDDPGIRGPGGGVTFQLWRDGLLVDEAKAAHPKGAARLQMGTSDAPAIVYLPEIMRPTLHDVRGIGGDIEPAPLQPRWICYGDSVAEGWLTSAPALTWPAIAGREHSLDVVNMGYAGAGRGEIVSAENIAELAAAVISITHGTNCWNRIPFSTDLFRAQLGAFLDIVRQGHRETPVLVVSPILRLGAEETANRLGATLADLRAVMEDVVRERIAAGDERLMLVEGRHLITEAQLADDVHPNDDGHRALAAAIGPELEALVKRFPEKAA